MSEAARLLRQGCLVAFPTETVYGLGGDATNDNAVARIYEAKGRPQFNPLIIHVAAKGEAENLVVWNDTAEVLARRFWPGPLTLVLPRRQDCAVSLLATAGLDSVAVRIPAHPVAHDLIKAAGCPVAAPSANAFGKLSPTTPEHVLESLGDKVDMILDGGKARVGVESTVIDLTLSQPSILRPGGITREMLEEAVGPVGVGVLSVVENPKSPGMLSSHYAPNASLRLNVREAFDDEGFLCFGDDSACKGGKISLNLSSSGDVCEAASNLFVMLRQLDASGVQRIAVMPIPDMGLGAAINDRLIRAASPRR